MGARLAVNHLVSLGHPSMRLDERGRVRAVTGGSVVGPAAPQAWTWLSQHPRVAVCPRFASPEECAHLINKFAAESAFSVIAPRAGGQSRTM